MKNNIKVNLNTEPPHPITHPLINDTSLENTILHSITTGIKSKLKNGIPLQSIPFIFDSQSFSLLIHILTKPTKSSSETLFIAHYLTLFPTIKTFLSQPGSSSYSIDTLCKFAKKLHLRIFNRNDIIYKFGDKAEHVYFIIKGKVSQIAKTETKIEMFLYEYIKYMEYLLQINEKELYDIILSTNKLTYTQAEVNQYIHHKLNIEDERPHLITSSTASTASIGSNMVKIHYKRNSCYSNNNKIDVNEYINRIHPLIINFKQHELIQLKRFGNHQRKEIILWMYNYITDIGRCCSFGEVISSDNDYHNTTIICNEDNTYVAYVDKNVFMKTIMDCYERYIRSIIRKCEVFGNINQDVFIKHYLPLLTPLKLNQGEFLFEQGNKRTRVYYLIEGYVELSFKGTLTELAEVLVKSKQFYIDINDDLRKCKDNFLFAEYYVNKVHNFKLFQIANNDVIGLNDCTYINNAHVYNVSALCKSTPCKFLSIDIELFNYIMSRQDNGDKLLHKIIERKRRLCGKRMLTLHKRIIAHKYDECQRKLAISMNDYFNIVKPQLINVDNKTRYNLPKRLNAPKDVKCNNHSNNTNKTSLFITEQHINDNNNNTTSKINNSNIKRKVRSLSVDKSTSMSCCSIIKSNNINNSSSHNVSTGCSGMKMKRSTKRILIYKKDRKIFKEIKKEFYSAAFTPDKVNESFTRSDKVYESMFKKYIDNVNNDKTSLRSVACNVDFLAVERQVHPYKEQNVMRKIMKRSSYDNGKKFWKRKRKGSYECNSCNNSWITNAVSTSFWNSKMEGVIIRKGNRKYKDVKHLSLILPDVDNKK